MADNTTRWPGRSGAEYTYFIEELPWRPRAGQEGNYIFAKVEQGTWVPIYVGHGDLQARYDAALLEGCIKMKGATHYHVHLNSSVASRVAEERDVIEGNPACQWPKGCNGHD